MKLDLPTGYDFTGTLGQLSLGTHDPCRRFIDGVFWHAARTPDGPGSLGLHRDGRVEAYGPGAEWLLERADAVFGLRDDLGDFRELARAHPVVAELAHRHRGLRLPATGQVFPHLLRAVCEQKVTGKEAYQAYSAIVRRFREPAPGPHPGLLLPPSAEQVASLRYYDLHPLGLEQRRADTLLRAARTPWPDREPEATARRMLALVGIGPWTVAEVMRNAHGDPDAVSVGDYHIKNQVAWALAGEPRATDDRMLELLEPFRGHRGRVCQLLTRAGIGAPRWGPRAPIRSFRGY
ncbi:MAG: DNA-3-methyladenine glycosylase 2 family protein [Hamadaea sp.]|nr:DNA-3-methyladenine glycosylase 2 family protein [Hamadaea sp.]NUT02279.1 DNA-3-methyladenine glycosylase 2 family protein [Hamadaea sp.]